MKRLLLVYLPFCTPVSPPYSLAAMHAFLAANSSAHIDVLDLNVLFHERKFPSYQEYFKNQERWSDYDDVSAQFLKETSHTYSENNKKVVRGEQPEFFDELLNTLLAYKPDVVAFSIVYSSQAFFAKSMLLALRERGITTIIGGPATNAKLVALADHTLANEIELLAFIEEKKISHDALDFSSYPLFETWNLKAYFIPTPVLPLKTTTTCFHKKCTFCAHYAKVPYFEYDMNMIKKTILASKEHQFFLIDDMIPKKRLLEFAAMVRSLQCTWSCQLRPTKDLDFKTLKTLADAGLVMVIWGFESGSQRILDLIQKGTAVDDVEQVVRDAKKAGIANVLYTMFGFPTETKEELLQTIEFLERNKDNIDLISSSTFGLQEGTPVYENYKEFGITKIVKKERTVLEPQITFEVASGLQQKEVMVIKNRLKKRIEAINKYPKTMNFFREHMMLAIKKDYKQRSSSTE
ncbi:MAG: radical SAM protein [Candidatus Woesearchaeota archaeon]|nr:MAG: radical SAM protein [Candidatus Woesearchaeota archaeon]